MLRGQLRLARRHALCQSGTVVVDGGRNAASNMVHVVPMCTSWSSSTAFNTMAAAAAERGADGAAIPPNKWRMNHLLNPQRAGKAAVTTPTGCPITLSGHASAVQTLRQWPVYTPTPLVLAPTWLADECNVAAVYLKDETRRFGTGSFKVLGGGLAAVEHVMRSDAGPRPAVATASAGNHALGVAWGCRYAAELTADSTIAPVECHVFLPAAVSEGQADRIRGVGGTVHRVAGTYEESLEQARTTAVANGWRVIQDVSAPNGLGVDPTTLRIYEGYTVLAGEIVDALETSCTAAPTHVMINGGVGGLIAAVSAHLWARYGSNRPRVIAVEPLGSACLMNAAAQQCPPDGMPPTLASDECSPGTIQVGLDCKAPDTLAWQVVSTAVDDFVAIGDECCGHSQRLLARLDPPIAAGDSAVAGLGVLLGVTERPELREHLGLDADSRVAIIVCEGSM